MKIKLILAALSALLSLPVLAATPDLTVEAVQMPAWVEHVSGARDPLVIGAALANRDRIYTGPGSRVLLRLADGSAIKLGENAVLALDDLGQRRISLKNVVTASLDVVSGAFRFTTQALSRFRGERDVKVKIVTITAGIRGTDVWGKAEATRDIVCLIEGQITVVKGPDGFTMDQAKSFYIAPKNAAPLPVAPVPDAQFAQWASETEIASGAGAIRRGGQWRVYLAEAKTQADALDTYDKLRSAGYAAQIQPVSSGDALVYRVRISNFASRDEANALVAKLKGQFGLAAPAVRR